MRFVLFVAAAFGLGPSFSAIASVDRPNVLLIVSEDNGPELGCYGDRWVRTLHLDQLAATGCRFQNAYTTQPVCSAARASFLTGLYPFQNGQIGLATHQYAMYRHWDNLPSILKAHGYRTGLIGKLHVNPESAFPFDFRYNNRDVVSFNKRDVVKMAQVAGDYFAAGHQPFFLSINYSDAHFPLLKQQYGLPKIPLTDNDVKTLPFIGVDNARLRQGTADYYNCLMRLDTGIGLLLDRLRESGQADKTLVMYIGDHGAQFSRGKTTVFEGGLRIPMIIKWPGQTQAGTVRQELVSTVDLLPTVLQATGLPARSDLPGRSLLPLAAGQATPWRSTLFAERTAFSAGGFFPQRTLRDARYKLIHNLTPDRSNPVPQMYANPLNSFFVYGTQRDELENASPQLQAAYAEWEHPPEYQLFDLQNDPYEFHNRADDPELKQVRKRLISQLLQFRSDHNDPLLDPDQLKRLAQEHDTISAKPNGRLKKGESWRYVDYLAPKTVTPRRDP